MFVTSSKTKEKWVWAHNIIFDKNSDEIKTILLDLAKVVHSCSDFFILIPEKKKKKKGIMLNPTLQSMGIFFILDAECVKIKHYKIHMYICSLCRTRFKENFFRSSNYLVGFFLGLGSFLFFFLLLLLLGS